MFGLGKKHPFKVTLLLSGRHPYMESHEYDHFDGFKEEAFNVMATGWKDAENKGFDALRGSGVRYWSSVVKSISRPRLDSLTASASAF